MLSDSCILFVWKGGKKQIDTRRMWVFACEQGLSGSAANWRVAIGSGKGDALIGQAVYGRRPDDIIAINARYTQRMVIGQNNDNIFELGYGLLTASSEKQQCQ